MRIKGELLGILLSSCLFLLLQGCTDEAALPVKGEAEVPVQLCARDGALQGSADTRTEPQEAFNAFDASVAFSTAKGNYTSLSDDDYEGVWEATVGTDGAMVWKSKVVGGTTQASPFYPRYGDYFYLVAYAPIQVPAGGQVTYALTGQEDLLYVSEMQGNRWDGDMFSGNTDTSKNKILTFNHLLTRLCFKACKKQAGGLPVKITRITVKEANTQAVVPLKTGVPEFSATTLGLSLTLSGEGVEIANTTAVTVGNLMLPPLGGTGTYTLKVETSVGTFDNIQISYGGVSGTDILKAGISHEVTLTIFDKELFITSIEVKPWTPVNAGDVDIKERD